jgi:hypothetical protein
MSALVKRKTELLDEISKIKSLRRGQVSQQFYEKTNASGEPVRTGPYFVWQASVRGAKRSIRIRTEEVGKALAEIENGKRYKALCEELADVMEQIAMEPAEPGVSFKKNLMRHKRS